VTRWAVKQVLAGKQTGTGCYQQVLRASVTTGVHTPVLQTLRAAASMGCACGCWWQSVACSSS
jgi:hypothetical protein